MRLAKLTGPLWVLGVAALLTLGRPPVVSAQSSTLGLTIPSAHPRIWWTADRITRARTWYQSNPFTPRSDDPLGQATRCLLTGESAYCQAAVNYAMNQLCSNAACTSSDPNYGVAADDARWEGEHVILVFDWCYQYFTAAQRTTLIDRWNTYFANIRLHSWGGPSMVESNYNWGYMRNEIEWGIATWGENSQASTNLQSGLTTRWANNIVPHFNGPGKGGVFQEGSAYGSAVGEYATVPFTAAGLMGRDMHRETNFYREAILYMVHATLPAPTYNKASGSSFWEIFPFADDERFVDGGMPTRVNYGTFVGAMADTWRDNPLGEYARKWLNMLDPVRPYFIRAIDRGGPERDFATLPLDYFASGPRFMYGRNQWGGQATVFNLQLGVTADEGHRHNDVGTWQMWRAGRWLSRESTGYSQTVAGYGGAGVDTNNAAAHNSLFVGGRGPASGYHSGPTVVTRLESRTDYSYVAVDLTPVYRATHSALDNTAASHVEREFLFVRPFETMVVFDRIESSTASAAKTFMAHFETAPTVDIAGKVVTAVNGSQALRIMTLVPSNPTYRPIVNEGGAAGQYRLEVETAGVAQSYLLNVLQAKGATDPNLTASVVDNGSTYTVNLTHPSRGTAVITLQKGRTTSGGSITVNGQTRNLTTAVSTVVVTDAGVTWDGVAPPPPSPPSPPAAPANLRIVP